MSSVFKQGKTVPKVVVVGAGFGGIATIQTLKKSGVHADITLVSKSDTFEYYPGLYKLVTGALAIEVSVHTKKIRCLNGIRFEQAVFTGVDPSRQVITIEAANGEKKEIAYDYLVLALGSETNYFGIAGLPEYSYSFKSIQEAFRLKRHFCEIFSTAHETSKDELMSKLQTVIVGGGPSGVELAGDIKHYLQDLARQFSIDPSLVTVELIEAANRILPTLPENVSQKAEQRLRMMGINIFTNRTVMAQNVNELFMEGMQFSSKTVIWTAGTKINTAYQKIPGVSFTERKRILVNEFLALPTDNHIFVIGDGAGTPYSGLAQTAIYDGKYIGNHLERLISGKSVEVYKPHGVTLVIPIGKKWALFVHNKKISTGFFPWLLRTLIDVRYLVSIIPFRHVIEAYRHGYRYRRSKTYCPID